MEKKIFAFDLDGTLLNHNSSISKKTLETLTRLKNDGHIISIATGRSIQQAKDAWGLFPFEINGVFNNGSVIKINNKIKSNNLSKKFLYKFIEELKHIQVEYHFSSIEYSLIGRNRDLDEVKKLNHIGVYYDPDAKNSEMSLDYIKSKIDEGVDFQQVTIKHEDEYLHKNLISNVIKGFEKEVGFIGVLDVYTDFNVNGTNKYSGVLEIAKAEEIPLKQVYCFGDNYNDISMFEGEINSVAMINAVDILKEKANYITKKDNNNDGIHFFIEDILKI
ncbi:MAG: HAD family hydrolase [Mollicutes bacterium PWAP]|nr:HAD family hydrolase [Mollicutes bacterium PWAP]